VLIDQSGIENCGTLRSQEEKIANRANKRAMKATIEQQAPDKASGSGQVISL